MSDNDSCPTVLRIAIQVLHMCILKCNILDRQMSPICDITDKAKIGVATFSISLLVNLHI